MKFPSFGIKKAMWNNIHTWTPLWYTKTCTTFFRAFVQNVLDFRGQNKRCSNLWCFGKGNSIRQQKLASECFQTCSIAWGAKVSHNPGLLISLRPTNNCVLRAWKRQSIIVSCTTTGRELFMQKEMADPKCEQPRTSITKMHLAKWFFCKTRRKCFIFLFTAKHVTSWSKYFEPGRALFLICISVLLLWGFYFLASAVNFLMMP